MSFFKKIFLLILISFALIFFNAFIFGYWAGLATGTVFIALIVYVFIYHIFGFGKRK